MASPDDYRISDAMYDILWVSFKKKYGSKVKLGGIYANKTGYHDARAGQSGNYSVRRTVDRKGSATKSAAIDWTYSDKALIKLHTKRLLKAYDNSKDPRIGPHNTAEFYGTTNGYSVVGRLHGKWATSDNTHLWHIHFAVNRQWIDSAYVMRAVYSVLIGESLAAWDKREHGTPSKPVTPAPVKPPVAPSWDYQIKKGDTLRRVAQKYNTSVEAIVKITPTIKDPSHIQVGQIVKIPGSKPAMRYELPAWNPDWTAWKPYLKSTPPSWETNKKLQRKLNSIGYKLGVDGRFDREMYDAVRDFQKKNGLDDDGIVGVLTWNALRKK